MKKIALIILTLLTASLATAYASVTSSSPSSSNPAMQNKDAYNLQSLPYRETCNMLTESCEERIITELNHSSRFILYQTDNFNSRPIAKAIASASKQKKMITELVFAVRDFRKPRFTAYQKIVRPKIIRYANWRDKVNFTKTIIIDGNTLILQSDNIYTIIKNNPDEINNYIRSTLQYRDRSIMITDK